MKHNKNNIITKLFLLILLPLLFAACSDSGSVSAVHSAKLSADFAISSNALEIKITDNAQLSGAKESSREWDFGDGTKSTAPAHRYTYAGAYTVTLNVTDDAGKTYQASKSVKVGTVGATADFSYTVSGKRVTFQNDSLAVNGAISAYSWEFGDSKKSADKNASNEYSKYGVYPVKMTFTDNFGEQHSIVKEVTVSPVNLTVDFSYTTDNYTAGTYTAKFTDATVIREGSVKLYKWDFGDNKTAEGEKVSHEYATGEYTATLTVVDSAGYEHKISKVVRAKAATVIPDFKFTQNSMSFAFENTTEITGGTIASYEWTFGDSSTPETTQNASHTYATAGEYTVTLKVTDNYGKSYSVYKKTSPGFAYVVPNFKYTQDGYTVTFTADATVQHGEITSYEWAFGDESTASGTEVTHTYKKTQNYNVTLTVKDSSGKSTTISKPVAISPSQITPIFSHTVSNHKTVTVTDESVVNIGSKVIARAWNFGEGEPVTTKDATHTYDTFGEKTITLTLTDSYGTTHTVTNSVMLNPPYFRPDFSFTSNADGVTYNFTATADTNIDKYEWAFGATGTATGATATHKFTEVGSHDVTLKVTDGFGMTYSVTKTITILPVNAIPDFTYSIEYGTDGVHVFVKTTDTTEIKGTGSITKWVWISGNNRSNNQHATLPLVRYGEHEVTLTVTDSLGVVKSITKKIWIETPKVTPNFTVTKQGDTSAYKFNDTSVAVGFTVSARKWTIGTDIIETADEVTYTFTKGGVHNVTLEVTDNKGKTYSVTKQVNVLQQSTAQARFTISYDNADRKIVTFKNESVVTNGYKSFKWDFGDGTTNTTDWATVTHTYSKEQEYTATLTVTDTFGLVSSLKLPVMISPFVKSLIGYTYGIAMTKSGELYHWGYNDKYVGIGRERGISRTPQKVTLPDDKRAKDIAIGADALFAITTDGELYTWGMNDTFGNVFGILDAPTYLANPTKVVFPTGAGKIISFSAWQLESRYSFGALAVDENGDVYGWGINLGYLTYADGAATSKTPSKLATIPKVKAAQPDGYGMYYLADDKKFYQWNGTTQTEVNSFFDGTSEATEVVQFAVQEGKALVLTKDGKVYEINKDGTRTERTFGGFKASSVARAEHSAVVLETGDIFTWGVNSYGQLGHGGTTIDGPIQVQSLPFDVFIDSLSLPLNTRSTSAVTSIGEVYVWGGSLIPFGVLGVGEDTEKNPTPIRLFPPRDNAERYVEAKIFTQPAGKTVKCFDDSTIAFDTSITHEWDFGDNSPISTEMNPSHTYSAAETYNIKLTLTDSAGKKHTATTSVTTW